MATNKTEVIKNFLDLLVCLSEVKSQNFSGVGFVLYDHLEALSKYHCSLVNEVQPVPFLQLGTRNLLSYLIRISNYSHPYHDGFHFINIEGVLTHVAQFFSPPINKSLSRIQNQGARTFCSQCGSKVKGVLLIGSVSSNRSIYLFEKGRLVNQKNIFAVAQNNHFNNVKGIK